MAKYVEVPVKKLKRGDRFCFIPGAWHGPSVVISINPSGAGYREIMKLQFDNKRVVNWPGIQYIAADEKVRKWVEA